MGPVEDRDLAPRGQAARVPPQVVVIKLLGRRRLETRHMNTLRVDAAHHVSDRAVLAGRVDRLQHDQDAIGVLRGQPVLVFGEQLNALPQKPDRIRALAHAEPLTRIKIRRERDLRARPDPQRLGESRRPAGIQIDHEHRMPQPEDTKPARSARGDTVDVTNHEARAPARGMRRGWHYDADDECVRAAASARRSPSPLAVRGSRSRK